MNDDRSKTTWIGDTGDFHNGTRLQRQDWAMWQTNKNAARRVCDEESGVSFLIGIVEGNNPAKMDRIGSRRLLIRKGMGLPRGRQQGQPGRRPVGRLAVSSNARQCEGKSRGDARQ
jgi:hypothetical protein